MKMTASGVDNTNRGESVPGEPAEGRNNIDSFRSEADEKKSKDRMRTYPRADLLAFLVHAGLKVAEKRPQVRL